MHVSGVLDVGVDGTQAHEPLQIESVFVEVFLGVSCFEVESLV